MLKKRIERKTPKTIPASLLVIPNTPVINHFIYHTWQQCELKLRLQ